MKTILSLIVFLFISPSFAKQANVDPKASTIDWLGQKISGDEHKGNIKLKSGTVSFDEKMQLTGGTFVIDMTTIEDTDLSGEWKKKLTDHLNSADFFDTAKHKEATFKITKVTPTRSNMFTVDGNLTLRGQTKPETFELKVEKKGDVMVGSGVVSVDRNKYGITYNSEESVLKKLVKLTKDKIIKDKFQLTLNLQTEKI